MRKAEFKHIKITANNDFENGESIEFTIRKAMTTKQPIEADAPLVYTARKDGVRAETNIRTDRWEIAQNAMDKVNASYTAKREEFIKGQIATEKGTETAEA